MRIFLTILLAAASATAQEEGPAAADSGASPVVPETHPAEPTETGSGRFTVGDDESVYVVQRRSYVTPLVTEGLVGSMMLGDSHGAGSHLTARQREVIQLLAEGHSMKEIAGILNIAPRTVAFHKYRIMDQLHLKTTAELIQFAVKHHIV